MSPENHIEEDGMTVVVRRKQGEALTIRFNSEVGEKVDVVIYLKKITASRASLYISPLLPEASKASVEVHRIEHFEGEEFETMLERVEEPAHRELNIYNMQRYHGMPTVMLCVPPHFMEEDSEETT